MHTRLKMPDAIDLHLFFAPECDLSLGNCAAADVENSRAVVRIRAMGNMVVCLRTRKGLVPKRTIGGGEPGDEEEEDKKAAEEAVARSRSGFGRLFCRVRIRVMLREAARLNTPSACALRLLLTYHHLQS